MNNKNIPSEEIGKSIWGYVNNKPFELGETVYHRDIYEHREPLKIVGILEDKLLLEGDFSGGTHNVIQCDLLPIKGTSRIYNHTYKLRAREDAIAILSSPMPPIENINDTFRSMINMAHIVTVLTNDVSLNPEYQ